MEVVGMAWSSLRLASALVVVLAEGAVGCAARPLVDLTGGAGGRTGGTVTDGGRDAPPDRASVDVSIDLPEPRTHCGDRHLDPGEACDDGNLVGGDGCSSLCQVECNFRCGSCGPPHFCIIPGGCGDGVISGAEQCDDGPNNGDPTLSNCTSECTLWAAHACGDGVVDTSSGEACDFGAANGAPGSLCTSTCQIVVQ